MYLSSQGNGLQLGVLSSGKGFVFNPDISATQKFYKNPTKETIPTLDVVNLIMRLISNIVLKTDIYIILGVYLILSFAMSDFNNDKIEDSPCATYVRDVLSKL